ncbi:MAG: glutathione S-transferase family protein [Steroidobacteraceae bacterium]
MGIELYYFQPLGTNSGRVFLTLLEKGVEFSGHELDGQAFEHLGPAYLAVNPRGQVPALVHDGQALAEGACICEYVDEAFVGPPLRPASPDGRWRMRRWCRFIETDIGRALMMIHWNRIVPAFVGARTPEELASLLGKVPDPDRRRAWRRAYLQETPPDALAESHRRVAVGARRIEAQLAGSPWIAGPTFSLADIDLLNFYGFIAKWSPEVVNERATPHTMMWLARMEERPAVLELRARTRMRPRPAAPASRAG